MFWLIRKIFSLAVLAALVFVLMQVEVKGHPLKDYVVALYETPVVQSVVDAAKNTLLGFVDDLERKRATNPSREAQRTEAERETGTPSDRKPLENLKEDEVRELEKVLRKQNEK